MNKEDRAIFNKTHGHCVYCGKKLYFGGWHKDHVFPKSRGGRGSYKNLVPSCIRCNLRKHSMTPEDFKEFIKRQFSKRVSALIPDIYEFVGFVNSRDQNSIQDSWNTFFNSVMRAEVIFAHEDVLFDARDQ